MNQITDFFRNLFDSSDWPPRWYCGRWTDFHGWLYIISDLLIWSAYFSIPLIIIKYITKKQNTAFVKLYFLFAAFILACGSTHLIDAIAFWVPAYRLSALVRFITGVLSWITVFSLIRLLPIAFSLKTQKELQDEVDRREKMGNELEKSNAELQAFSYSVSHDLRAPLRGIIGFTTILEEDYVSKLDDEAKRITSIIKSNTLKMARLIDDLLAFSKLEKQDIVKTSVDTNTLVKNVKQDLMNSYKGFTIDWVIKEMPSINADINAITQVWINLISNAIKYSRNSRQPRIEIGHKIQQGESVFYVKDNGVGFDPEYKDKLFKVFQRLHSAEEFEGTGVGLAIVEKIVLKHGGRIWAEAEKNKGATFYFTLPA